MKELSRITKRNIVMGVTVITGIAIIGVIVYTNKYAWVPIIKSSVTPIKSGSEEVAYEFLFASGAAEIFNKCNLENIQEKA